MEMVAKGICWLAVLILGVGVGTQWLLLPESTAAGFGITLDGLAALNQARGDIGGAFVALACVAAFGLTQKQPIHLQTVAIVLAGVMLGRAIGLVVDGFDQSAFVAFLVEGVMVAGLWITAQAMSRAPSA